jgi:pimeloyl-ACP methyl ester carboxylesterase
LILEAPYTSTIDVAASLFPIVPVSLLMRDRFHSDRRIAGVTVPLLVMHGDAGERLFAMAREPKQFVRFPGGGHDNLDDFGALETARQFIGGLKG